MSEKKMSYASVLKAAEKTSPLTVVQPIPPPTKPVRSTNAEKAPKSTKGRSRKPFEKRPATVMVCRTCHCGNCTAAPEYDPNELCDFCNGSCNPCQCNNVVQGWDWVFCSNENCRGLRSPYTYALLQLVPRQIREAQIREHELRQQRKISV